MAKFRGFIGYSEESHETSPGVWTKDVIVERKVFGDVLQNSKTLQDRDKVNDELSIGVTLSVMTTRWMERHHSAIKYVDYAGSLWKVENIQPQRPRTLLRLGGEYTGTHPDRASDDSGITYP